MSNKISKVQLNSEQYALKGDATNIKDVMLPTIDDLYSKIGTGGDRTELLQIYERLASIETNKANQSEIENIWSLINYLILLIPSNTINYFFAYKQSSTVPDRPGNDLIYPPQGWDPYPVTPDSDKILYMTMARKVDGDWLNWDNNLYRWTLPVAYSGGKAAQPTVNIESNIALYKLSEGVPTLSTFERQTAAYPSGWSPSPDFVNLGNKEIYMITAKTINGEYVLVNGYYWSAPMRIGNGTTSGTGADGKGYNYVYALKQDGTAPVAPSFSVEDIERDQHITEGGVTWYDRPQGVSETNKYEFISVTVGSDDAGWSSWSPPVVWSKWGERGMDGDAVEYIYKRTEIEQAPYIPSYDPSSSAYLVDDYLPTSFINAGWTDNPTGVDANTSFEYVATRKKKNEIWQAYEGPWLWAKYGKDGVVNGYLMTCNNTNVIADDDLFTKSDALARFNTLATATFNLLKTDGTVINPTYSVGLDSVLPNGITAVFNGNVLSFTGSFTSSVSTGDVFYVNVNGKVNGETKATLRQTIYVKNFSQGESYRLIVTPTSKKVAPNGKFTENFDVNIKFLVVSDILSTEVNFVAYDLKYDIEIEGDSSRKVATGVQTTNTTLNVNGLTAPDYYVVNLYKTVSNSDVLVDSQTISIYKDGEQGPAGSSSVSTGYTFEATPTVLVWDGNAYTTAVNFRAFYFNGTNRDYTGLTIVSPLLSGLNMPVSMLDGSATVPTQTLGSTHYTEFVFKLNKNNQEVASLTIPVVAPVQGINGAVLRYRGKWDDIIGYNEDTQKATLAATFEFKSPEDANIKYIDVVTREENEEFKYYQCKLQHSISANTTVVVPGLDTNNWESAEQFKFLVTDTLIADYMSTHTIAADDVVITERNNSDLITDIVAGMTSSRSKVDRPELADATVGDVRIWAGTTGTSPNLAVAPFVVNQEGLLYASDAVVRGCVIATNGEFWGTIHANGGTFKGEVSASTLLVVDYVGNPIVRIGTAAEDYAAANVVQGMPVIYVHWNNRTFIVNLTEINSGGGTITTYNPMEDLYYMRNNNVQNWAAVAQELKTKCHKINETDDCLYREQKHSHSDAGITYLASSSLENNFYRVDSSDPELNGLVVDHNKNPFTGNRISALPEPFNVNVDSNNFTNYIGYKRIEYREGRVVGEGIGNGYFNTYYLLIGAYGENNGNWVTDFCDETGANSILASTLGATSSSLPTYQQLSDIKLTYAVVSNQNGSNPGLID